MAPPQNDGATTTTTNSLSASPLSTLSHLSSGSMDFTHFDTNVIRSPPNVPINLLSITTPKKPPPAADTTTRDQQFLVSAVLFNPNLLTRILSYIYDAPSDYKKGSHLISLDQNDETYSLGRLYDTQWVCRFWQSTIYSSRILPFKNPTLATGDHHRLHVPFLTWLGSKMKDEADLPTVPKTDFASILPEIKQACTPLDGFDPTDFITDPAVPKIWLAFQADSHPPFTYHHTPNPEPKKRKAICCPIGPSTTCLEYSFKTGDHKGGRIIEDAFVIYNPTGVTILDVMEHMLNILSGYYRAKQTYMLWLIEIGIPVGEKEVLHCELDLEKRMKARLYETCNRSARIFLVDSRLEIKNEGRVTYKPPAYDPFFNPKKKNKKKDEAEGMKLSLLRSQFGGKTDESEDEESGVEKRRLNKGKGRMEVQDESDILMDEDSYGE
ncbi:hypothetical protein TWF481_011000 [Arthrobotrys musiformis]|uniref:F-box domain-containing protein n=1 Tax=Arthrobotrys musiformis TaxID=47236 RepID=A0AAV9VX47_9PEZI